MIMLRESREDDIAFLTGIYEYYVRQSSASFEIDPPDAHEMSRRRKTILDAGLPYLVAEVDGEVAGYAYATLYRPRAAYRYTVEDSIYVRADCAGRGLGRRLLSEIIARCEHAGYRQMIAVIGGSDNAASIGLHAALGFEHAGLLRSAGFKFGCWTDSVLMQRSLGPGDSTLPGR